MRKLGERELVLLLNLSFLARQSPVVRWREWSGCGSLIFEP